VLVKVRHGVQPGYTRIVLDMSAPAEYTHRLEENPPRVVLEIPGGTAAKGLSPRSISTPLVNGVRVERLRGPVTLVAIDLARSCTYRTFSLPAERGSPPRIVVDLFAGDSAPGPAAEDSMPAVADPPGRAQPDAREAVADAVVEDSSTLEDAIPAPAEAPASAVRDSAAVSRGDSEKIEEFVPAEALRVQGEVQTPPAPASQRTSSPVDPPASTGTPAGQSESQASRKRIVAIDAGHGGADTGARRGTIEEKRICLDFAKRLAAAINAVDGFQAYLTRDDDTFLPLRRRYQLAEQRGADVFVSIHANAARSRAATGTEVFFLSLDGASDEAARDLAQKENESDRIGGVSPEAEEDLTSIIKDLRRSDALRRSSFLAEAVLEELLEIPGVESRGVKQAGFTVLKSPQMPSVLVETGFLSNAHERSLLTDPRYQEVFVHRLRDGLLGFFREYGLAQP
jgi:N-acetylmuramoyl-L-alanine amidase